MHRNAAKYCAPLPSSNLLNYEVHVYFQNKKKTPFWQPLYI